MFRGLLDHRIVLVTGKGGVGKTTLTTTLARLAADSGKRVLVAEIATFGDDESALASHFGRDAFTGQAEQVADNIQALILLAQQGQERFVRDSIGSRRLAQSALSSKALQNLLAAAPSARELGILYHLLTEIRRTTADGEPQHQHIIVDMPASGHALGLTSLPNILLPILGDSPLSSTLMEGQSYFCNPDITAAIVVTIAESMAITECQELCQSLTDDDIAISAIVVNQMTTSPLTLEELQILSQSIDDTVLGSSSLHKQLENCLAVSELDDSSEHRVLRLPDVTQQDIVTTLKPVLKEATC